MVIRFFHKKHSTRRNEFNAGFTLLEVLISVAIFSMIFIALLAMLDSHSRVSQSGEIKADVQQNARIALETISRDLRHAGFFPEYELDNSFATASLPAKNGLSVLFGTANSLILQGTSTTLAFPLPGGSTTEIVYYTINAGNLTRKLIRTTDVPALQWAGGSILATNVTAVAFSYFDGTDAALIAPLDGVSAVPANGTLPASFFATTTARQAVRRIVVTLALNEPVPGQGGQVYTLTSDVRLRNGCAPIRPECKATLL